MMAEEKFVPFTFEPVEEKAQGDIPLSPFWAEKARIEVNEIPETRLEKIAAFRKLVEEEENLYCPTTDEFLVKFLRAKKFDPELALSMLKKYFTVLDAESQNFEKALPSLAAPFFNDQVQTVLPCRDHEGRRMYVLRAGQWDPSHGSQEDFFAANHLLYEMIAREPKTQVAGVVLLVDFKGSSISQLMSLSRDHIKSSSRVFIDTFPLRFREIHIVNQNIFFNLVYAIGKPLLPETIKSRIKLHGNNFNELCKRFHRSILPKEFGGTAGPVNNKDLVDILLKNEEYFKEWRTYGYNKKPSQ